MPYAIDQGFVQNSNGRVQPGAEVTVYVDTTGQPIATQLYADREGSTPKGNPFTADADGYYFFYAPGGAYKLVATYNGSSRTFRHVAIGLGAESDQIAIGAGASWKYDSATAMADPGSGEIRLNNATHSSATAIAISATSNDLAAMLNVLMAWDDSTNTIRGTMRIAKTTDKSVYREYNVTGTNTNNTTWVRMTIAYVSSDGVLTAEDAVVITFARAGNVGSTGAAGASPGPTFTFSTTTTMADPGAGLARLNNATLSSVTLAALDASSNASGNPAVRPDILTWDDSTNTQKGTLRIYEVGSPQNFAVYNVTGVTDNTGWVQLALSYVTHGGAFANADNLCFVFSRTGDKGADGAGTGDVVGPASAVDNRVASFDGATGKLIQDAGMVASALAQQGKQTIWMPAGAMTPRLTNGAAPGLIEMASNLNMVRTLDFDPDTEEFAQFEIHFPKSWNLGTLTFQPVWSHPATVTNFGVVWSLQAVSQSDSDALDVAFGTALTSTDTGGTTNDRYIAPESAAITAGGTPAAGDVVVFQLRRVVGNGSDTLAVDARLHGIRLFFTTNAATDA